MGIHKNGAGNYSDLVNHTTKWNNAAPLTLF